jgi:hypothetical protein
MRVVAVDRDSVFRWCSWSRLFLLLPVSPVGDIRTAIETRDDRTGGFFFLSIFESVLYSGFNDGDRWFGLPWQRDSLDWD